jgi:hypothetical protein
MKQAKQILTQSAAIIDNRAKDYGNVIDSFERAATLATMILQKSITIYDISMISMVIKLSRISNNNNHEDSYMDAINYLAFAAQIKSEQSEKMPSITQFNLDSVKMKMADALSEQK